MLRTIHSLIRHDVSIFATSVPNDTTIDLYLRMVFFKIDLIRHNGQFASCIDMNFEASRQMDNVQVVS